MAYQDSIPRARLTTAARIVYADRKVFLAEVGFKTYRSYLASDLWKGIRAKVLRERPACEFCGSPATQVHHSSYWPAVLRGEATKALHPTCASCHKAGEFSKNGYKRSPVEATRSARKYGAAKSKFRPRSWKVRIHDEAKRQGKFAEYMAIYRSVRGNANRRTAWEALLGWR